MSLGNAVAHKHQSRVFRRRVWLDETVAIKAGVAVCYDRDRNNTTITGQLTTDAFGGRDTRVKIPTITNNYAFAGVTSQAYKAQAGGQSIEIYEPGSVCPCRVGLATVVGVTRMTFTAGGGAAGMFIKQGFGGRGSILALETTTIAGLTSGGGPIMDQLDGTATAIDATGVITDPGSGFTNIKVGDVCVILGGVETVTPTEQTVPGEFAITASNNTTTITISSAAFTGDCNSLTFLVVRADSVALCHLEEGPFESGGVQFFQALDGAVTGVMVGGYTYVMKADLDAIMSNTTAIPVGTFYGQKKAVEVIGDLGSTADGDWNFSTAGTQIGGTTGTPLALAAFTFDAVGEIIVAQWDGGWRELYTTGLSMQAS